MENSETDQSSLSVNDCEEKDIPKSPSVTPRKTATVTVLNWGGK